MKYIVFENKTFTVFHDVITHSHVAHGCREEGKPVGAGFVNFSVEEGGEIKAHCWGKSITLNLISRIEEDEKVLNEQFTRTYNMY